MGGFSVTDGMIIRVIMLYKVSYEFSKERMRRGQ